jgi:hypothetical protein
LREKISKDKVKFETQEKLDYIFDFNKKLSEKQEEIFKIVNNSPKPSPLQGTSFEKGR